MEEQTNASARTSRTARTVPMLVVLVLIVIAVASAYVVVQGYGQDIDPASYIPQDVAMAATVDINCSSDQLAAMDFIEGLFNETGTKPLDNLFKDLDKELEMDVRKFATSHLNGKGAVGVLSELSAMMPQVVAVIGAKSRSDADSVMTLIGNQLNKRGVAFRRAEYEGMHYYAIPSSAPAAATSAMPFPAPRITSYVGAVKSTVVYANSESAFKKAVDTAGGKPNLLACKDFTTLRKSGPKTFATTYMSGPNLHKMMEPMLQLVAVQDPNAADGLRESFLSMVALVGTAEASADGIRYSAVSITKDQGITGKGATPDELVEGAPADAAIVIALANIGDMWKQYQTYLTKNSTAGTQFEQMVSQISVVTGLNLRTDVLDRLKSFQAYYVPAEPSKPGAFPGEMNIVLQVDNPQMVEQSIKTIHTLAALSGKASFAPVGIAEQQAFRMPIDTNGTTFADAVVGDKVILQMSGTEGSLENAIARTKSKAAGVSSTEAFQRVKSQLPAQCEYLIYGDVGAIVKKFADSIPEKDRKTVESITSKVGSFGMAAHYTPTRSELEIVIPFAR